MRKYWVSLLSLPVIFLLSFVSLYALGDRVVFRGQADSGGVLSEQNLLERVARQRESAAAGGQVKRDEQNGFELAFNSDIWEEGLSVPSGVSFGIRTKSGQGMGNFQIGVTPRKIGKPSGKIVSSERVMVGSRAADHFFIEETYFGQKSVFEEYHVAGEGRSYRVIIRYDQISGVRAELEKIIQTLVFAGEAGWVVKGVGDDKEEASVEEIVELVRPSVVGILYWSCRTVDFRGKDYHFCGSSKGSGFIVSSQGYVITNAHVADPSAEQLLVEELTLPHMEGLLLDVLISQGSGKSSVDLVRTNPTARNSLVKYIFTLVEKGGLSTSIGQSKVLVRLGSEPFDEKNELSASVSILKAQVVDADRPNRYSPAVILHSEKQTGSDVALLKLESNGKITFPAVKLMEEKNLKEGSKVIVVGFPLLVEGGQNADSALLYQVSSVRPTVTTGIISAVKTDSQNNVLIQTDASIEQGNSGGPGFDKQGEVLGIVVFGVDSKLGSFNFLRSSESVLSVLKKNNLQNNLGGTSQNWEQGLNDFRNGYYTRSLAAFGEVKSLYPVHPTVDLYISDAQKAIATGADKGQVLGMDKRFVFAGTVSVTLAAIGGGIIEWLRRKRQGSL